MRDAALAAGAVLTATGRGDLWTIAIALGVADESVLTALVVGLAGVATLARTGSAAIADIAGSQAVLGAAGVTGSAVAIAATWAGAVSLLVIGRSRWVGAGLGLVAGALVAGPSPAGGASNVAVWAAGLGVGGAVGWFASDYLAGRDWIRWLAVALGGVGLLLGVVAGYN